MIEKYKKYLVVGYAEFYNLSVNPNTPAPSDMGPMTAEVWATDKNDAIEVWKQKVIPFPAALKRVYNVKVREL